MNSIDKEVSYTQTAATLTAGELRFFAASAPYLSQFSHRFPVTVRYVQGGCAISRSHFPTSCICPSMVVICPPLDGFQRIPKDMPLRMAAGTFDNVTGIGFVSQLPKFNGHRLGFLTRYQDSHSSPPPLTQQQAHIAAATATITMAITIQYFIGSPFASRISGQNIAPAAVPCNPSGPCSPGGPSLSNPCSPDNRHGIPCVSSGTPCKATHPLPAH